MQLDYSILNVFTDSENAGNPLAIVLDGDRLTDDRMQKIAAEFNLSETVFICRPDSPTNVAKLRIFTPTAELPFAGHPTVGTGIFLGRKKRLSAVRMEEKVGRITCLVEIASKKIGSAKFLLPQTPEVYGPAPDNAAIAVTLGIDEADVGCGAFPSAIQYSAGLPFYLIPVRNANVLANLRLERRGWKDVYPERVGSIYVFTETPSERNNDLAARMFSPDMPGGEDPATGSAAGALIGLLATDPTHTEGQRDYKLRQGHEMGRPSLIELQVGVDQGKLVHCGIGGSAIVVAEGKIDVTP